VFERFPRGGKTFGWLRGVSQVQQARAATMGVGTPVPGVGIRALRAAFSLRKTVADIFVRITRLNSGCKQVLRGTDNAYIVAAFILVRI
jgi:hypothetical protein